MEGSDDEVPKHTPPRSKKTKYHKVNPQHSHLQAIVTVFDMQFAWTKEEDELLCKVVTSNEVQDVSWHEVSAAFDGLRRYSYNKDLFSICH